MPKRADPAFATTVDHGLKILEAFGIASATLSNKELSTRTGLSPATVSRLTTTLASRELVSYDHETRSYQLAPSALTIGYPLLARLRGRRRVLEEMKRFAHQIDATVSLGLRDRDRIVFVESTWGSHPSAPRTDVGAALPLLNSAVGRAWLAASPSSGRADVIDSMAANGSGEQRRELAGFRRALREFRDHGFCSSLGEWRPDVDAVAVPLYGLIDDEIMVVSCGLPHGRMKRDEILKKVGPGLKRLASRVAAHVEPAVPVAAQLPQLKFRTVDSDAGRTLARGVDVLQSFSSREPVLSHSELCKRLALDGPTMVRLTHTLMRLGYLRRAESRGAYSIGGAALALAYPLLSHMQTRAAARPILRSLSDRLGGAASIGIQHRAQMVYVDSEWRDDGREVPPDIGSTLPMLNSAMGRAWLCSARTSDRRSTLNRIRLAAPDYFEALIPSLDAALLDYRRLGYCVSDRELRTDILALAAPLQVAEGRSQMRYVLNCGLLASGWTRARAERVAGPLLLEAVRLLESRLRADD